MTTVSLLVIAVAVGLLIGSVGVGGVLLAPALVALGVMSAHQATATSTWAFLFTGVVGTVAYARARTIAWGTLARLVLGVVPGAFLGARVNALLSGALVLGLLGLLTLLVGAYQLVPRSASGREVTLRTPVWVVIGAVVGFGSALTGTGGPVLLVPLLLALDVAPLAAVALSQAVQLPVVAAASLGYAQAGLTDVRLGSVLGVLAAAGTLVGALCAPRLNADRLRQLVAVACVGVGLFLLVRAAF